MIDLLTESSPAIADLFEQYADAVKPDGHGCWQLELSGARPLRVTARLRQDWLLLTSPLDDASWRQRLAADGMGRLLEANARLDGGVKFCAATDPTRIFAAAQLAIDDEPLDLGEKLSQAFAGFRQAIGTFSGTRAGTDRPDQGQHHSPWGDLEQQQAADLMRFCEAAGWSHTRRANGQITVPLEVRDSSYQAYAGCGETHGVCLCVELETDGPVAEMPQCAIGVLLLSACGAVRMARATATANGGQAAYRWEVPLGRSPSAAGLHHALAALSIACRLSAREVQVLTDEALARKCLESGGWSWLLSTVSSCCSVVS